MSIASQLEDLPSEKREHPGWTKRSLVSIQSTITAITKSYNVFEITFFLSMVITAFGELFGRHFSNWWFMELTALLLLISFLSIERNKPQE